MLASLAARAISTVTSPFKPSASPLPPASPTREPVSPSPSTRSPPSRILSDQSQTPSELSGQTDDLPVAASNSEPSSVADESRLRSSSPADDDEQSGNEAGSVRDAPSRDKPQFAAKRSRTTRAGLSDVDRPNADDPTRGTDGKAYLTAGLYWSSALSTRPSAEALTATAGGSGGKKRARSTDVDWRDVEPSRATALPPPAHHGETLIEDEHAFRLPFDILRDFYYAPAAAARVGKGKGKGKVGAESEASGVKREGKGGEKTTAEDIAKREKSKKPDPYRFIAKNIYFDRRPDKAVLPAICTCTPPTRKTELGCSDGCINRLMQYCCDPKKCPCGPDRCSNPPLNKRVGVPEGKNGLRVIWTGNRGFGLKTMVDIRKGDFVIEYRGEIISRDESYRRVLTTYKNHASYYFMDYDGFEVVDAGQRGNAARFINHSCGPNLEVVRWRLASVDEYQMGLFALHDIPAGTELTYDYGWQDFASLAATAAAAVGPSAKTSVTAEGAAGADAPATTPSSSAGLIALSTSTAIDPARQRCYCGAAVCSGFLGGRKQRNQETKGKPSSKGKPSRRGTAQTGTRASSSQEETKKRTRDELSGGSGEGHGQEVKSEPPAKRRAVIGFAKARVALPVRTTTVAKVKASEARTIREGAVELVRSRSGRKAASVALGKLLGR